MNVPFQVKVPIDIAQMLRSRLADLQLKHQHDLDRWVKAKRQDMIDKAGVVGRTLTIHNLMRAVIQHGATEVAKATDATLITWMQVEPIVMGRPRGSRAA